MSWLYFTCGFNCSCFTKQFDNFNFTEKIIAILTGILVYWNGIYFMNQVVVNYSEVRNKLKN